MRDSLSAHSDEVERLLQLASYLPRTVITHCQSYSDFNFSERIRLPNSTFMLINFEMIYSSNSLILTTEEMAKDYFQLPEFISVKNKKFYSKLNYYK